MPDQKSPTEKGEHVLILVYLRAQHAEEMSTPGTGLAGGPVGGAGRRDSYLVRGLHSRHDLAKCAMVHVDCVLSASGRADVPTDQLPKRVYASPKSGAGREGWVGCCSEQFSARLGRPFDLPTRAVTRSGRMQTPTRRVTRSTSKLAPIDTSPDADLKAAVVAHQNEG